MRAYPALMALMILPACAMTTAPEAAAPTQSAGECAGDGLDAYVGRTASAALGAELLAKSGARTLRWGPPNSAMTMDFRPDRLTVSYDEQMLVTRASCG